MKMDNARLIDKMIEYFSGDPKRIQHFLKVYGFAELIGKSEDLPDDTLNILETAAIVHDIGIRPAEERFGRSDGKLQERLGPPEAEKLLTKLGYDETVIDRVSYLVGHHHTYENINGLDHRILVEADFLVNMYEDGLSRDGIGAAYGRIFKTESGRRICRQMFALTNKD